MAFELPEQQLVRLALFPDPALLGLEDSLGHLHKNLAVEDELAVLFHLFALLRFVGLFFHRLGAGDVLVFD